jgi:hypothetical protein
MNRLFCQSYGSSNTYCLFQEGQPHWWTICIFFCLVKVIDVSGSNYCSNSLVVSVLTGTQLLLLHFKLKIWIRMMWCGLVTKERSCSLLVLVYWILLLQIVATALPRIGSPYPKPVQLYLNEKCIRPKILLGDRWTSILQWWTWTSPLPSTPNHRHRNFEFFCFAN